jgi:hypothetical protein
MNWDQYHDYYPDETFYYLASGDENSLLTKSGLVKRDAEKFIENNMECARAFLLLARDGSLDFCAQQSLVRYFLGIHRQVHRQGSKWQVLRSELDATLQSLIDNIPDFFAKHGHSIQVDMDDLKQHAQYGDGSGAILHGLGVARAVALAAFIQAFARKLLTSSSVFDLCGEWSLRISKPQYPDFAKKFTGIYGFNAEASIKKLGRQSWEMHFLHFPPLAYNWYSVEGEAYKAAAPIVAVTLCAEVSTYDVLKD